MKHTSISGSYLPVKFPQLVATAALVISTFLLLGATISSSLDAELISIGTDGQAGSRGTLNLTTGPQKELSVTFQGQAAITNFASVDSLQANDFVSWKELNITGISAASRPISSNGVSISSVLPSGRGLVRR